MNTWRGSLHVLSDLHFHFFALLLYRKRSCCISSACCWCKKAYWIPETNLWKRLCGWSKAWWSKLWSSFTAVCLVYSFKELWQKRLPHFLQSAGSDTLAVRKLLIMLVLLQLELNSSESILQESCCLLWSPFMIKNLCN